MSIRREESADAAITELGASLDENRGQVRLSAGEQRAAWPTEVPLTADTIYLLRPQGSLR
jgi:hypothetical protein